MQKNILFLFLAIVAVAAPALSQEDTLPKFSVRNVGNNRIIVGWTNRFENIRQISVQRSYDSLNNFKTILTVPDPTTPQNGFADTKAPNDRMFYRLYILLDKGVYLFSDSKRPVLDTALRGQSMNPPSASVFPIMPGDTSAYALNRTKPAGWIPSKYVFTNRDGYIRIQLPDTREKKYSIRFFTNEDDPLFELNEIKDTDFKIDKSNFYRSGWFKFELYEDGELKEKNKFFLPKEF